MLLNMLYIEKRLKFKVRTLVNSASFTPYEYFAH